MPSRSLRVQKTRSSKPTTNIHTRKDVVTRVNNGNVRSNIARKRRSILLSSGPDMADIPRYESPPTTPPRIDRNDESQDGRDRIQTQIEELREAATQFKEERETTQRLLRAEEERQIEVRSRINQHQPQTNPRRNLPRFYEYDIDGCLLPLTERYPAINPEYFQEIFENKFKPENLSKLSNDFSTSCQSIKRPVSEGNVTRIVNMEEDAKPEAIKDMQNLSRYFDVYIEVLFHVTSILRPSVQNRLRMALYTYRQRLLGWGREGYMFETIRTFHLAFHKARAIFGIDNHEAWRTPNHTMETQYLKKRNWLNTSTSVA